MIKVVSFDVDGTLIDQEYNDIVWLEEVPRLYAQARGVDDFVAYEYVKGEFDSVGPYDLRWYDLNYWLKKFELPFASEEILEKFSGRLRVYPDAQAALDSLSGVELIIVTSMPRDFLKIKLRKLNGSFKKIFSTVSDFSSLKTAGLYREICGKMGVEESQVLHVGDLWDVDYVAPRQAGLHALCVDRSGELEGDGVIRSLKEIPARIEGINARP